MLGPRSSSLNFRIAKLSWLPCRSFPPVSPFLGAGASMPWLPAFAGPGGLPTLVTVRQRHAAGAAQPVGVAVQPNACQAEAAGEHARPRVGDETTGGQVYRGSPAIASGGKAAEGEIMDAPAGRRRDAARLLAEH
jgi:hypothetical protein